MLNKTLVLLAVGSLVTHAVCAQETAAPGKVRSARNTTSERRETAASATPEPAKRGFFKRVFGKKEATPTPAPATTPVPKSTPRPIRKPRPVPAPDPNDAESSKKAEPKKPEPPAPPAPTDTPETHPPATETPAVEVPPPAPAATPVPVKKGGKKPTATPVKKAANTPPDTKDPDVLEKWKYDEAKARALEDAEVAELKSKADAALSEEDGRKALKAYNRALFAKMRRVDPSIKDRIDRIESSVMKRLGGAE